MIEQHMVPLYNLLCIYILFKRLSTQNQPNCKQKLGAAHAKKAAWKKLWNQRWQPRSGCGGLIMAKFLITITQVNLWIGNTNLPELLLLKILPLSDHHSHFWAATFDFTTSFMLPFLHGPHLFYSLTVFV